MIGAKDTPKTVGRTLMANLTSSKFEGKVYPINPHREEVLGIPCFKSVADAPPVDLAVIVVPAAHVPEVMRTCAQAHVKAVIIISAGFAEIGEEGRKLEEEILSIARASSIRIIGPNCLGIMNPSIGLNATFARGIANPGSIAFISQSGALCTAVLDWSLKEKIGFSAFVSIGSMSDVGWGDLIEYFGEDPSTKSILMYMESVRNPRMFMSGAKEVSWRKPIIVIKPGRSKEGAHAAASHTGALAGSDEVFDAACERAGVLRVDSVAELFDMAQVLAHQPTPTGPRLAIVTNAGGPAVLATDALVAHEGEMATLSDTTLSYLDTVLPPAWSHGNPVDILGDASAERYRDAFNAVVKDPGTDGVVAILTPQDMTDPTATAKLISEVSNVQKKPIITSWMGGDTVEEGKQILASAGIPSFSYPDAASGTFGMMWNQTRLLQELFLPPRQHVGKSLAERIERRKKAKQIFTDFATSNGILTERASKMLMALYGFRVVEPLLATTEDEAIKLAQQIGYPVVLKVEEERITHKARSKGVFLNLKDEKSVREAFRSIQQSVAEQFGKDVVANATVQKMIQEQGVELIVGSKRDEQFGQVILFGAGGVHVEVFGDMSLGLPPLTSTLAGRMIQKTKIARALKSSKKGAVVPLATIEDFLIQFSEMILENPEIAECDLNPVLATASTLFCLDARLVIDEKHIVPNAAPPYADEYVHEVRGETGKMLRIRPVKPEDATLMKAFHERLSNNALYKDIFAFLPFPRLPLENLLHLCHMDRRIVLVVEGIDERQIVGIAAVRRGHTGADLFIAYEPDERVGELLLLNMKDICKKEGIEKMRVSVRPTNRPLISLLSSHGFTEVSKNAESITFES